MALKFKEENWEKWAAYEKRLARWQEREEETKPPPFSPKLDLPVNHPVLKKLDRERGILSDSWIHFTPEYLQSQNWQDKLDVEPPMIRLVYFISDQRTIERELILMTGTQVNIHYIFDECFDKAFSKNAKWQKIMGTLGSEGMKLSQEFKQPNNA